MQQRSSFFDSVRRSGIYRGDSRWFGGVASGYAAQMNISPLLMRAIFIALSLFGGLGAIIYGISWALLPEQSDGRIHLQEAFAGRFDGALALAGAITLTGVLSSIASISVFAFAFRAALPGLVLATAIGVFALLILFLRPRGSARAGAKRAEVTSGAADADAFEHAAEAEVREHAAEAEVREHGADTGVREHGEHGEHGERGAPIAASVGATQPLGEQPTQAPPVYRKAPTRRRTPGPGRRIYFLSLALPLLAGAGILAASHWGTLALTFPVVAVFGAGAVLLGLITIGLGIAGRRAGAINVLAIGLLLGGAITGTMTLDAGGARALAWNEAQTSLTNYEFEITSVEQLRDIDWEAIADTWWTTINLAIPPEDLDGGAAVDIPLPAATTLTLNTRTYLPIDLRVSGVDAYVEGDFHSGELTSLRAIRTQSTGYSIARGGYVHYQNIPATSALTLNVDAAGASIYYRAWNE